ncbi:MAG: response regulator [Nitrospirae bacterium]|nr:response regulator [Nitrospirota bacterium]
MQDKEIEAIKALVIDDSAFNRQTIRRILEKDSNIQVVGVASDGQDGIVKVLRLNPDVITLDLEMPGMDGFTFLRWIMKEKPTPVIIVSSYGDSQTVFKALDLGAVDFVVKPTRRVSRDLEEIETDLLRKIESVTSLKIEKLQQSLSLLSHRKAITEVAIKKTSEIEMIAIGASTGGPAAIQSILTRLPADFPSAVVISQHMPRGFTRQFAERVDKLSMIRVKEAEDGEVVEKSKAFVCPGGFHMTFKHSDDKILTVLKESSHNDKYFL